LRIDRRTDLELKDIATKINPIVRGWIQYYGKFYISKLSEIGRYINLKRPLLFIENFLHKK